MPRTARSIALLCLIALVVTVVWRLCWLPVGPVTAGRKPVGPVAEGSVTAEPVAAGRTAAVPSAVAPPAAASVAVSPTLVEPTPAIIPPVDDAFALIRAAGNEQPATAADLPHAVRWRPVELAEGLAAHAWRVGETISATPFADTAWRLTVRRITPGQGATVVEAAAAGGEQVQIIIRGAIVALRGERTHETRRWVVVPHGAGQRAVELDRRGELAEAGRRQADPPGVPPAHPAHPAPAQPLAGMVGGPGLHALGDLPAGAFRERLQALTPAARQRALDNLRDNPLPAAQLHELEVDASGGIRFAGCPQLVAPAAPVPAGSDSAPELAAVSLPIATPPVYHSRSGATNVLFLDFNGAAITDTDVAWSGSSSGTLGARAFSTDSDYTTFSDSEQTAIYAMWQRVAEDYAPFDIDVTTEDPGTDQYQTMATSIGWVIITDTTAIDGSALPHSGSGGIAYVNVFGKSYYPYYRPCWVTDYHSASYIQYMAMACSHEFGHNLGLSHDGTSSASYYSGHGSGVTGWAPIMGAGTKNVEQWSKGDYLNANNTQDDLAIISGKLSYLSDDHGDGLYDASEVTYGGSNTTFSASGVIETTDNPDTFSVTAGSGAFSVTIAGIDTGVMGGSDLACQLELYQQDGTLVASAVPTSTLWVTLSTTLATAGTYIIKVTPVGLGTPTAASPSGFTSYGSLGQYTLSGTCTVGPPEIELSGNGQVIVAGDATPSVDDDTNFGAIAAASSTTRTYTITNRGSSPLTGIAVSVSGADFSVTDSPAATLAAHSSATFTIEYTAVIGASSGTVTVLSSDADEGTSTFAIQGGGTSTLTFGSTTFTEDATIDNGSFSTELTVTLSNDTFSGATGSDLITDGKASATTLQAGLTLVATRTSATTLTLSLSGTATAHDDDSDTTCTLTFADSAFTAGNAAGHTGYSTVLTIDFSGLVVTTATDSGSDATIGASLAADRSDGGGLSLREALAWYSSGTIRFASGITTITLNGSELAPGATVTVDGGGTVTIDAAAASRVLNCGAAGATIALSNLTLTNGRVSGSGTISGGGIACSAGTLTLDHVTLSNCTAYSTTSPALGGAVAHSGGTLTLSDCTISGCVAKADSSASVTAARGGAIYLSSSTANLSMQRCNLSGNGAYDTAATPTAGRGGALYAAVTATLAISDCTFSGNTAANGGGAILFSSTGAVTLTGCTLSGNSASSTAGTGGGAILTQGAGLTLRNCTLTANSAATGDGHALFTGGVGNHSVVSTIIAANPSVGASGTDLYHIGSGTMTLDYSLYTASRITQAGSGALTVNASAVNASDPKLYALTNNGGTPLTHALKPGSPAAEVGSNPASLTTDQRGTGYARVVGSTIDIGAFENQRPTLNSPTTITVVMSENGSPTAWSAPNLRVLDADTGTADAGTDAATSTSSDMTWSIASAPAHGTASFTGGVASTLVYTPTSNWSGSDSFTVGVSDGLLSASDTVTITVVVEAVNQAPVISEGASTTLTTTEDATGTLTLHASDAEGDTLSWSVSTPGTKGTTTVSGTTTATVTYVPTADANGSDTVVLTVSDGNGGSAQITLNVTITGVNDAPLCSAAPSLLVDPSTGTSETISLGTWSDDNDVAASLTYTYVWQSDDDGTGSNIVTIAGATASTLTVPSGLVNHGIRVVVTATDSGGLSTSSAAGWVLVENTTPTISGPSSVTMSEDASPTAFSLALSASDPDGQSLIWSLNAAPAHGTATVSGTGSAPSVLSYVPQANYAGTDTFRVGCFDGVTTNTKLITVTISAVNDPPVNTVAPVVSGTVNAGQTLSVTSGTWNDTADGGATSLSYSYQWRKASDGSGTGATDISGATGSTHVIQPGDVTSWLQVVVTATDNGTPGTASTTAVSGWTQVPNRAPVITQGATTSVTMSEDGSPTPFSLTLDASDADGHTLTWSITSAATHGTASVNGSDTTASIGYVPTADYHGSDSFGVTVADGYGGSADLTVTVTVDTVNDAPVITEGATATLATSEDTSGTLTLHASDVEGDTLTWSVATQGSSGTATVSGSTTATVTYVPTADANGSDAVVLAVSDGNGGSAQITVNVTITAINDAPQCSVAPSIQSTLLTGVTATIAGGTWSDDVDAAASLTYTYAWQSADDASGTNPLAIAGATGSTLVIPSGLVGHGIRVVVTATDSGSLSTSAASSWTLVGNTAPTISGHGSVTMSEDGSPTAFSLALSASDLDGQTLTWSLAVAPLKGTAIVSGIGSAPSVLTYVPQADVSGTDTFRVGCSDGITTKTKLITVTITAINDPPVNTVAPVVSGTVLPGQTLSTSDGTWNDIADGGTTTITYSYQWQSASDGSGTGASDISAATGSTYVIQTGDAGSWLQAVVTATDDGTPGTASATAASGWTQVPNHIPVITQGATASVTMSEDGAPMPFALSLAASDADGQALTWSISSAAGHGTAAVNGGDTTASVGYAPTADYNGSDSFTVTVSDGHGGSASIAVTVTITAVNDAPLISEGATATLATNEDMGGTLTLHASDAEGDTLSWVVATQGSSGTATVSGSTTATVTYTPTADVNGSDSVVLTVSDGNGGSAQITIAVTITAVNDAPQCSVVPSVQGALLTGTTATILTGTWSDDVDAAASLTYTYAWQSADDVSGTNPVTIAGATASTLVVPSGLVGHAIRVAVTATDSGGLSTTAAANWSPVGNTAPVISGPSTVTMSEDGTPTAFALALSASDPDGQTLTWSVVVGASKGTATVSGTGSAPSVLSYVPQADATGTDTFELACSDGLEADIRLITVTITAANDPPVNTVAPAVSGAVNVGQTLSATSGTWNDAADGGTTTITYGYQWQLASDSSGTGVGDITGATGATYVVQPGDVASWLRVVVTATDDGTPGTASATAASTWTQVPNRVPVIAQGTTTSVTMSEDGSPTPFALTLGASDADGQALTWSISGAATHGTAAVSGSNTTASVGYVPNADYHGSDSFVVTVSDGHGGSASITVAVTINAVNDAPVVVTLPTISGTATVAQTLTATTGTWNDASDGNLGTLSWSYQWQHASDASGSAAANIAGATAATWAVTTAAYPGYVRVVVTISDVDASGTASASAASAWVAVAQNAPLVAAGVDQVIDLPATAILVGTVSDDGLPNATITTTWTKISGPGTVTFSDAHQAACSATFSVVGTYVLRLTADDGLATTSDDVQVTVRGVDANGLPPVISPQTVTLRGTVSAGTTNLTVGGVAVTIASDGSWSTILSMPPAATAIIIRASDASGHSTTRHLTITPPPLGGAG